jgi:hypothetical protein
MDEVPAEDESPPRCIQAHLPIVNDGVHHNNAIH